MFLIHRLSHQCSVNCILNKASCGCVAIIQITSQHDLTHLWVKCDTTAIAKAHYFDILPSGSVPVTQRWTSLLILIIKLPTHQEHRIQIQLLLREMKRICSLNCLPLTTVQTHNTLTTIACIRRTYFKMTKQYVYNYLFLLPLVSSSGLWKVIILFLFPLILSLHKKAPDSFGPYQLQWKENKGVHWNLYSASLKGKLGR